MRSLYLKLLLTVLSFGTAQGLFAQDPGAGAATPRRVSAGVVEQPADAGADSLRPALQLQSPIFRDTMELSKMAQISLVAPGFSQLYNKQYLKIPVLYGGVGALAYLTIDANKKFQRYKRQHEFLMSEYNNIGTWDGSKFTPDRTEQAAFYTENVESVRQRMDRYNTQRTLYFAGAALTYLYFLADGVMNYPHPTTSVKRATTLAMMFPGAGQFYNGSYWKVPIVIGGFATMGYLIEWNQRSYKRYRDAYNNPDNNEFVQGGYRITQEQIKNFRDRRRRDRDFCIIMTGALYLLTVVEAHVDAHLQDFDVSDDLAIRVEPTLFDTSGILARNNAGYPGVGLSLKINF